MPRKPTTILKLKGALADCKPHSHRELVSKTSLTDAAVWSVLSRLWREGVVLRTKLPLYQHEKVLRGRAGSTRNLRPYHLYVIKPEGTNYLRIDNQEFVSFSEEYLDARGKGGKGSKAQMILEFLKKNKDKAFFSREIANAHKDKGMKVRDVMPNVKRFEEKGLVHIHGYRSGDRRTPFTDGYLITWLGQNKPREKAIEEAIKRADLVLKREGERTPYYSRLHRIRDIIIAESERGLLVSTKYLQTQLGCSEYELERALKRAIENYYPTEIKQVKLFDAYRYFYHSSVDEAKLNAMIKIGEDHLRRDKDSAQRIGHNWEAVAEWFIEKFTPGAVFRTQEHREKKMNPRRITLYLIKNVGNRKKRAEVDRVWDVKTSPFSSPTTNVLSCKWSTVRKKDIEEDLYEVLRWSKEFGVETPDGRQIKQGVVGVFAAGTFDLTEKVRLKDGTEISLPEYARRMNITLIKASELNERLHKQGCPMEVTVQKVCKLAEDENEVKETLSAIWDNPQKAEEILDKVRVKNIPLYQFERKIEESGRKTSRGERDE